MYVYIHVCTYTLDIPVGDRPLSRFCDGVALWYMYVCIYIGSTLLDPAIGTVLPYPSTSINQELSQISLMSGVKKKRNVNLIRVYY